MPQGKIKVYTQCDVIEIQKGFIQELSEIHSIAYDILHKCTNKQDVKLDLVKLVQNVYDRQIIIQKDINIEASNVQIKNASN